MSTDAAQWRAIADENMRAAEMLLKANAHRSTVSRAYYAAYSAVHELAIYLGQSPPERGNWPHAGLPDLYASCMRRISSRHTYLGRSHWINPLFRLYTMRILADYASHATVTSSEATEASKIASMIAGQIRSVAE